MTLLEGVETTETSELREAYNAKQAGTSLLDAAAGSNVVALPFPAGCVLLELDNVDPHWVSQQHANESQQMNGLRSSSTSRWGVLSSMNRALTSLRSSQKQSATMFEETPIAAPYLSPGNSFGKKASRMSMAFRRKSSWFFAEGSAMQAVRLTSLTLPPIAGATHMTLLPHMAGCPR